MIGQPIDKIRGRKLPSKGDVLRRLFFLMRTHKETLKQASSTVVQEVMSFWKMARIPTMIAYNVISKVMKEYDRWHILQKGSSQPSAPQIVREVKFKDQLNDLLICSCGCFGTVNTCGRPRVPLGSVREGESWLYDWCRRKACKVGDAKRATQSSEEAFPVQRK
jgi:hypothetical protein